MSKELVISATPHETRVAIVEDGLLCEIYIEREKEFALVGSLYKGRVTRVLPGMQSAFVDIGLDSDAFLYVSDFLEHLEDYDHVAAPAPKPARHEPQRAAVPEVFAPSTVNGGIAEPAAPVPMEPVIAEAAAAPPAAESGPVIVPLEGEVLQGAAGPRGDSTSNQHSQRPPFEQRRDRGPRGFGDRGDRGDRGGRGGRNRRWGRPSGGGRDRGPRRDLPQSKYASPKPFETTPRESGPAEELPANFEPIILPGESLAKYKNRPAGPLTPPAETGFPEPALSQPEAQLNQEVTTHGPVSSGLPESVFTGPVSSGSFEVVPPAVSEPLEASMFPAAEAPFAEAETRVEAREEAHEGNGTSGLTDEDVRSLAEQLIEAKHEEAQAEASDIDEAAEASLEPFVDAAEMDDLQDALHEEHLDAAEEAEAAAEEMHEEALAAEGHAEHEELNAGESHETHEEEANGEFHEDETEMEAAENTEAPGPMGEHETSETLQAAAGESPAGSQQPTSARIAGQPRQRFQRPMRRGGRPDRGRRGGRPDNKRPHRHVQHGHPRFEGQRRPQLISEMLKAGEEIIVQIAKEPLGKKGARITSHVALPGRFLVYMPTVDHIGVSRRIGSAEDRSRLRRVVTEAKGTFPGGFIVRTAAAGATDEEIRADVEFLGRTWDSIRTTGEQRRAPALLHRDLNLVERILRDYLSDDYVAIWLDNEEAFTKVVEFVGHFQPKMVPRVKLYTKEAPIFEEFGIQQELDKALRPKVWLKSGGYIVINHTEALVAIDVNTGKYVGRGSTRLEDTIVKTNLEAVKEIVRQIRLRDLGGIIVCDLIDMEERRNRDKVMAALEQELALDRAPSKALSFNEFGLVCITRKRTKQALERVLCQPCPYCTGSGMVKSIPTICYEIQAEARKMSADMDTQSLTLRVNPEIAKALKTRESSLIEELEQATRKSVIIQSDSTLHWEQYDIY